MKRMMLSLASLLTFFMVASSYAAEVIPEAPTRYFNDYSRVVSSSVAQQLNKKLEDFEKATSCQLVVAIYPKMQSNSSIEDYANRVFAAWKVGQKDKNNGAVLFVFTQDRRMRIEVGYGLEAVLTDALCKRIIEEQIAPEFRQGRMEAGMINAVDAMIQAAKGEYKGTGRTVAGRKRHSSPLSIVPIVLFFIIAFISSLTRRRGISIHPHRGGVYFNVGGWGGGGGGGSFGGGFSGGGGSSGGGGASGSW
jgi:uncharacterized protein